MAQKYVPFSARPEWQGVQPIPQDDGPQGGVCAIAYSPQFRETMDYFRAVVKANELSQRALGLTNEVIRLNAANYTAWAFRRKVLAALDVDCKEEMEWVKGIAAENPKNYQIWYHRRALVEKSRDPSLELDFIAHILTDDAKNYHAWAHRQWVLKEFNLWEGELDFLHKLLTNDFRNNSAWNQRYFVISNTKDLSSLDVKKEEIDYALSWIRKAPNNQSPWYYIAGYLHYSAWLCPGRQPMSHRLFKGSRFSELSYVKEKVLECRERYPTCAHALSLLVDIWQEEATTDSLQLAVQACQELADHLAQGHKKYWLYRKDLLASHLP